MNTSPSNLPTSFAEHQIVFLREPRLNPTLATGAKGTIVYVHEASLSLEVEFAVKGRKNAVVSLPYDAVSRTDPHFTINRETDALIVIDIQNDFCPGGALAVTDGHTIIPGVIAVAEKFDTVVLTQDWHPKAHASFASTHGQAPFSTTQLAYGEQTLWPDHCVQGSEGAAFHPALQVAGVVDRACAVVRKGMNPAIDSYSAFFENDKVTSTGLGGYLRDRGITRVFVVGLAYDFCVGYSAIDARRLGFEATVLKDLTQAINMPLDKGTTVDAIEKAFVKAGVFCAGVSDMGETASVKPTARRGARPCH